MTHQCFSLASLFSKVQHFLGWQGQMPTLVVNLGKASFSCKYHNKGECLAMNKKFSFLVWCINNTEKSFVTLIPIKWWRKDSLDIWNQFKSLCKTQQVWVRMPNNVNQTWYWAVRKLRFAVLILVFKISWNDILWMATRIVAIVWKVANSL
jgi:hypothetical protein